MQASHNYASCRPPITIILTCHSSTIQASHIYGGGLSNVVMFSYGVEVLQASARGATLVAKGLQF